MPRKGKTTKRSKPYKKYKKSYAKKQNTVLSVLETHSFNLANTVSINSSGAVTHLSGVPQGQTRLTRVGDVIAVTGLKYKLQFYNTGSAPIVSALNRCVIAIARSGTCVVGDFPTTNIFTQINPHEFKILREFVGPASFNLAGLSTEAYGSSDKKTELFIETGFISFKKPLRISYVDGGTNPNKNGLYMFTYSPETIAGGGQPASVTYYFEMYFKDV